MAKFIPGEMRRLINPILSFFVIWIVESSSAAYVRITQDGPGVLGSTISLRAELFDDHGILQGNGTQHRFSWSDNAMPPHKYTEEGEFSISYWNVTYASHQYSPGKYEVEVRVTKWLGFFWWDVSSSRINIDVTVMLNGQVDLIQNQTSLGAEYIAVNQEVHHTIQLSQPDSKMLASNDTIVHTYWFLDCEYFGSSQDRSFSHNYTKEDLDKVRVIRAIVVAGKEANNTIEESDFGWSDDVNATTNADVTTAPDPHCRDFPIVPKDPNKLYGYFTRNVTATAPVQSVHVDGQTWLKNGDVLHLNVTCSGSSPFYHCVIFFAGDYNVTGKEKCQKARPTSTCNVVFTRLMNTGTKYTALFIIGNRVSKTVTPVGITRYSEKHHPQLSVIIVPISCSVVAIVLIIFGVAYYIQSRNRFKIEVADFDFSRNSDTEYKTFKERLRDAVSSAFTRVKDDEYSEEGPSHYSGGGSVWSPTRKSRPPREGGLLYENSDSDQ